MVQNFLSDGTVLVADSSNRGKGSPTFIDSARRLGAEELQTIDDLGMPVATIDGDDELQVGASSEGDEHCLGCGALMRDSTLAFCSRCE